MANHKYTPKEISFIKKHIAGRSYKEMAELFNKQHFRPPITVVQLNSFLGRHKLRSGLGRYFRPGHIPHNKGLKGVYFSGSEKGWFKPCHKNASEKPVGSERINVDGCVEVKVSNRRKPAKRNWESKHAAIWEAANGKVPKGHMVIFADKNTRNFALDNLLLVSRKELAVMNHLGLIATDKDLTAAGKTVAGIKLLITKRKQKPGRRAGKSGGRK